VVVPMVTITVVAGSVEVFVHLQSLLDRFKQIGMRHSRAVGDSQGSSLSDRVGLVALDDRGWSRAVGGILADSLGGGDPDGRNPSSIGWRRNVSTSG
jgi:hypothetical protein